MTTFCENYRSVETPKSFLGYLLRLATSMCLLGALLSPSVATGQQNSQSVYEGFTQPNFDLMVAATEIGRIEEMLVQEGDRVKRGQTVARLEDALQVASVRIAQLQAEMRGEMEAAQAEVSLRKTRTTQIRQLAGQAMARPDELKRAESDLEIAEARYQAAKEQGELRRLELERYQLQLDRRRIKAPMDGVIAKIFHHPGEYVTPSEPAVVRLLVTDKLFAIFSVPVEDISKMSQGANVRVFLRSRSQTITAKIHSLSPSIDGESGTVQVRVALPNEENQLRAGDRCTMQLAPNKRTALLPKVKLESDNEQLIGHMDQK